MTVRDDHASALARGDALEAQSATERKRADQAESQLDEAKAERDRLKAKLAAAQKAPRGRMVFSFHYTPVHPAISFLVLVALLIATIALGAFAVSGT